MNQVTGPGPGDAWNAPDPFPVHGAGAKPLVPVLRSALDKADQEVAATGRQIIAGIERAKAESVPEAEAKKRATIWKEIREFVAGRGRGKRD